LTLVYFPIAWRMAITVIIRKFDKDNYSEANSYRPIELLLCLGKVFEIFLTCRMTFWAETNKAIAYGHMGRRCQQSTALPTYFQLGKEARRSLRWGKQYGTMFDKKKAQLMHFSHRKLEDL
ncbi:hypothetical protein CROQUDRAFT_12822, partial [Cronartium quercuum f. sp. fusiforme G11]